MPKKSTASEIIKSQLKDRVIRTLIKFTQDTKKEVTDANLTAFMAYCHDHLPATDDEAYKVLTNLMEQYEKLAKK